MTVSCSVWFLSSVVCSFMNVGCSLFVLGFLSKLLLFSLKAAQFPGIKKCGLTTSVFPSYYFCNPGPTILFRQTVRKHPCTRHGLHHQGLAWSSRARFSLTRERTLPLSALFKEQMAEYKTLFCLCQLQVTKAPCVSLRKVLNIRNAHKIAWWLRLYQMLHGAFKKNHTHVRPSAAAGPHLDEWNHPLSAL